MNFEAEMSQKESRYKKELSDERETNIELRGEVGLYRKRYSDVQVEVDKCRSEIQTAGERNDQLYFEAR